MNKLLLCILLITASLHSGDIQASEEITACSIVGRADAEKAAGVKLATGQLTRFEAKFMQGTTLCHFESLDGKKYKRFVNIELSVAASEEEAVQKYNNALNMIGSAEPVTSVGRMAVWGGDVGKPRGGLNILHAHYYLEIKVNREDDKQNRKKSIFLAKKILSGLN